MNKKIFALLSGIVLTTSLINIEEIGRAHV